MPNFRCRGQAQRAESDRVQPFVATVWQTLGLRWTVILQRIIICEKFLPDGGIESLICSFACDCSVKADAEVLLLAVLNHMGNHTAIAGPVSLSTEVSEETLTRYKEATAKEVRVSSRHVSVALACECAKCCVENIGSRRARDPTGLAPVGTWLSMGTRSPASSCGISPSIKKSSWASASAHTIQVQNGLNPWMLPTLHAHTAVVSLACPTRPSRCATSLASYCSAQLGPVYLSSPGSRRVATRLKPT